MVHLITIRLSLNEKENLPDSRAKKALNNIEKKLRKDEAKEQAKNKKMLKKLLTKVEENKLTKKDDEMIKLLGITSNIKNNLQDLIDLTAVINIMKIDIPEEDLPQVLQNSLKRYRKQQEIVINTEPNNIISEIKREIIEQNKIKTNQLQIIEPLHLFTLFHYIKDKPLRKKLQSILNLTEEMLPNDYLVFENLNEIVEKKHVTGQYFDYEIKKSVIAKEFEKIENNFLKKLDLTEFKLIPNSVIEEIKTFNYEINSVLKIQQDFNPDNINKSNTYILLFVQIFHKLFNKIPTIDGKKVFAKYILHVLDILEIRNRLTRNAFLELIKETAKPNGNKTTLSKEVNNIIPIPQGNTLLSNQDIEPIEELELVDELGSQLIPETTEGELTPRHINDEDIFNDDIYDDDLLDSALL